MATKFHFHEHGLAHNNSSVALHQAKEQWKNFSDTDKVTWKDNSPFNQGKTIKDDTGELHFLHKIMQKFATHNSNAQIFQIIKLSNTQGNAYNQAGSWNWTVK